MIKICDRTLSCLDDYSVPAEVLIRLAALLFICDADCLEISEKVVKTIGGLPPFGTYVMRIDRPEKADYYPFADRFICERQYDESSHIYAEIQINDFRDAGLLMKNSQDKILRLSGFDTIYRDNVEIFLANIKKEIPQKNEFSPGNFYGTAVAAAVEWVNAGCGDTIVTSFGGIGGYAPFEQVLICFRQLFHRHPQTTYNFLPIIRDILSGITGKPDEICSPVTGRGIFTVESGIHVNGIISHPKSYEPFPPETVGGERRFTFGKFSGTTGVRYELNNMGINTDKIDIRAVTQMIKEKSENENRSFSAKELVQLLKDLNIGS